METDLRALEQKIWAEAGEEFNVNSPVQARPDPLREARLSGAEEDGEDEVLFDGRRGPERARGAGLLRCPSCVLEYREISKLKGTYVDALPALADAAGPRPLLVPADGRRDRAPLLVGPEPPEHPDPHGGGPRDPRAFVAPPGRTLVVADYSQIELRILAHLSGDEALIEAFADGAGHPPRDGGRRSSASRPTSCATRCASRRSGSTSRCSTGWRAFTLGKELGVSTPRRRATSTPTSRSSRASARCLDGDPRARRGRTREVTTLFGRVRPIPDIAASNAARARERRAHGLERPVPGHGRRHHQDRHDPARRAPSPKAGLATRLVLQVHDELVLEAPDAGGRGGLAGSSGRSWRGRRS